MRMLVWMAVPAFLLLPVSASQESAEVLTNADIVTLTEAGLPADVIVAKIGISPQDFDLSVEALVALLEVGVDDAVLEAMLRVAAVSGTAAGVDGGGAAAPQRAASRGGAGGSGGASGGADPLPGTRQSWQPGDTFSDVLTSGGRGPEMVVVPPGRFQMGCVSGIGCSNTEKPVHEVEIPRAFAVSKYQVTFEDYSRFAMSKLRMVDHGWGRGRRPVINVSWLDAQDYVQWLSHETGRTYRLLSEAEWEYAARAGASTAYSWGNDLGTNLANCNGCGSQWDFRRTAPVGSFAANAWGIHDMHGNLWEWVEDCWSANYDLAPSDGSAWLQGDCSRRGLRGGSFLTIPRLLRSAYRTKYASGNSDYLGLRVARTLSP